MIDKIIINADDYGLTQGISTGILLGHSRGVISSTTVMMNAKDVESWLTVALNYPKLGLGVHLAGTIGKPITNCPSLVDEKGNFLGEARWKEPDFVDLDELYLEWKAQIEKFIAITKQKPTHLDSHHHIHTIPKIQPIALRLAKEYDLPMRQSEYLIKDYEPVIVDTNCYKDNATISYIKELCEKKTGIIELMCHPALLDQQLYTTSSYNIDRINELALYQSDEIKQYLSNNKIQIINYSDIKKGTTK